MTHTDTQTNTQITEFEIAEERLGLLMLRIDKLNERGARFGCPDALSAEVVARRVRNVRFEGHRTAAEIPMVTVRVTGRVFTINGWTFCGRIECTPGGNIVHRSPEAPEAIDWEALRERAPFCDHCNTRRRRIDCFVLHHADKGETKLVGRSCLADYLRDADEVKAALKAHKLWLEIDEWFLNWNAPVPGCWGRRFRLDVATYLAFVCAAVRLAGWAPRGVTAELADEIAHDQNADRWPSADDFAKGAAIASWAASMDARNEYERNLKAACGNDRVDPRNRNLVASAWKGWDRAMTAQAEGNATGGHFGTVGDELERTLKVTRTHKFDGRYGETTIVNFVDRDGNRFAWFGRGDQSDRYERGTCYKVRAVVKAHRSFRDVPETLLTRCYTLRVIGRAA